MSSAIDAVAVERAFESSCSDFFTSPSVASKAAKRRAKNPPLSRVGAGEGEGAGSPEVRGASAATAGDSAFSGGGVGGPIEATVTACLGAVFSVSSLAANNSPILANKRARKPLPSGVGGDEEVASFGSGTASSANAACAALPEDSVAFTDELDGDSEKAGGSKPGVGLTVSDSAPSPKFLESGGLRFVSAAGERVSTTLACADGPSAGGFGASVVWAAGAAPSDAGFIVSSFAANKPPNKRAKKPTSDAGGSDDSLGGCGAGAAGVVFVPGAGVALVRVGDADGILEGKGAPGPWIVPITGSVVSSAGLWGSNGLTSLADWAKAECPTIAASAPTVIAARVPATSHDPRQANEIGTVIPLDVAPVLVFGLSARA